MNTKLQQPTKKKIGQVVPLLSSFTQKLNVPHRSVSSAPHVTRVSRQKPSKPLEISISSKPTIHEYPNKSRKTSHENSFESSKTKASHDNLFELSRIETSHNNSFESSKTNMSQVIMTKNNERYKSPFKVKYTNTEDILSFMTNQ
ncbi:unnamed protein product [Rotaria sordida]|uniref:Uncharacterized protein n=1 Tax=Rotaria sordida TaxID=392033 RepID=A0A818P980_9BILA|nr:unnamed protein product [Rotaria sordida]CAF3620512.1 unnamed protein product [Rotaria sordida]